MFRDGVVNAILGLISALDQPRKEKGLKIRGAGSLGTLPSQTNAHEEPRTVILP